MNIKDFVTSYPTIETARCIRYTTPKSKCEDCKNACPTDAIEFEPHPSILSKKCIECGICYAACRFSAISIHKDDEYILKNIENSNKITIGCIFSTAEIKISCISRLTESLLIPLMLENREIEILRGNCKECKFKKTLELFKYNLKKAISISKSIGIKTNIKIRKKMAKHPFMPSPAISRRDILKIKLRKDHTTKRILLLETLDTAKKQGKTIHEYPYPETASITISEDCTLCGICEHICPVNAIKIKNGPIGQIMFNPAICVGCAECQSACLYKAIEIKEGNTANLNANPIILIEIKQKTCPLCNRKFYSNKMDICSLCQSKQSKKKNLIEFLKDI